VNGFVCLVCCQEIDDSLTYGVLFVYEGTA